MKEYLTELVGTFIFLYVILSTGKPIAIGITLIAMIYFGGKISGGAFNPAVSLALFLTKKLDFVKFLGYVVVQCVGAYLAFLFFQLNMGES